MSRLFPKSLFGQTLLILLAGLIISHAVGSWLYTADREQAVRAIGGFAAAQRIANLTRLVQDAPREWRERIVTALSDQTFRVSLTAQPPADATGVESDTASQVIKQFLAEQLPGGSGREPRVIVSGLAGPPFGDFPSDDGARPDDARIGPLRIVRSLPRSSSRDAAAGRTVAEFRNGSPRDRPGVLQTIPSVDGGDGHHHPGRVDLGGAARHRAAVVACRCGRAAGA